MYKAVAERLRHVQLIARWWWATFPIVWSAFCSADFVIHKWASGDQKFLWDKYTGQLPVGTWQSWLIGLLIMTVVMLVDGSYRHHRNMQTQHEAALAAVQEKLQYPQIQLSLEEIIIDSRGMYFDCFVFVRAHNLTPDVVTRITATKCEIALGDAFYSSIYALDDVRHFERVLYSSTANAEGDKPILAEYDLGPGDLRDPLQRGIDKKGWLHFCIDLPLQLSCPGLAEFMKQETVVLGHGGKGPVAADITRVRLSIKDSFDRWHSTEREYQWTENDGVRAKQRL